MPWVLGAALSALGCTSLSVGLNLEKLSLVMNEKLPAVDQKVCYHQRMWLSGFALFLVGNILNFLALSFAPSSLLAPLGSISIVVNAIASSLLLGETFSKNDLMCLAYIVAGCTLAVMFSSAGDSATEESFTPRFTYQAHSAFTFCHDFARMRRKRRSCIFYIARYKDKDKPTFLPFAYSFISGLFGSLSFLSSKVVSLILSSGTLRTYPYPFLVPSVCMLIFGATRQIKWMNLGLTRCEALVVLLPTTHFQ